MLYVDLAELPQLFRGRWLWSSGRPSIAWLRRADYIGDASISIDAAVRQCVMDRTGVRPSGPIRMLTHLRYFGLSFNPVTFYYCFDPNGTGVETVVAEITNTPWNERHAYVLTSDMREAGSSLLRYRFNKTFHVSPFMQMDVQYDWRFGAPGERLTIHMENLEASGKTFDATLDLDRRALDGASMAKALAEFPCMTAKVVGAIYWQALRLWAKRIPFFPHPERTHHAGDTGVQL